MESEITAHFHFPLSTFHFLTETYPSFSISSTSSPKRLSAELMGSAVLMSTPAIFKREMGSVLHPPEVSDA